MIEKENNFNEPAERREYKLSRPIVSYPKIFNYSEDFWLIPLYASFAYQK